MRNGHNQPLKIQTGIGTVAVDHPPVNDRRCDSYSARFRFTSKILPPYPHQTRNLEEFIPWLYLRDISTNGFSERLQRLTGNSTASLSTTTVVRLKKAWSKECRDWHRRSLSGKRYVCFLGRLRAL